MKFRVKNTITKIKNPDNTCKNRLDKMRMNLVNWKIGQDKISTTKKKQKNGKYRRQVKYIEDSVRSNTEYNWHPRRIDLGKKQYFKRWWLRTIKNWWNTSSHSIKRYFYPKREKKIEKIIWNQKIKRKSLKQSDKETNYKHESNKLQLTSQ